MVFGMTVSRSGTVLAFTEARVHYSDDGPHHLVMKRSLDGGATWQSEQVIEKSQDGECWANPTALVDHVTGKLFIFYALNAHNVTTRMFYKVSSDDGLTWSGRIEVTALLQQHNVYGWTLFLPGPGHGLQLQDGRLVLQYWGRKTIELPAKERYYGNGVIYSEDHGETWLPGGVVPMDLELCNNESRIVELESGELILNARSIGKQHRVISISKDKGVTWSKPEYYMPFPPRMACDSGMVRWAGKSGGQAGVLLYSTITSKRFEPDNTLEVSVSFDEGNSWSIRQDVFRGPCNYSDLAVLPDNHLLVLLGAGAYEHSPGFAKEVVAVRVPLDRLIGG
jgi:sialidase-1